MDAIYEFILIFINLFIEMSFYLLLGLFFVSILSIILNRELILKYLGKNNFFSVLKAALFGVPLPLCSCGVVPTAVYMSKNGASNGAVISFLISTPQTGIDSIIATYGMMGPFMAIYRPTSALISGIIGGSIIQASNKSIILENSNKNIIDCNSNNSIIEIEITKKEKTKANIKKGIKYAFIDFIDDTAPQFLLGLFIASLITFFIPDDYFSNNAINSGILGMLIMIAIGIPMYICSTASIPIAVSLILKGFSPGVAFVFLFVGPATNAATLAILFKTLEKRVVFLYLLILVLQSFAFGYLLDFLIHLFNIDLRLQLSNCTHCDTFSPSFFEIISSLIFLILIIASIYRIYLKKYFINLPYKKQNMNNKNIIKINGMNCSHCSNSVKIALESIPNISNVKVDHQSGIAEFDGNIDIELIKKKIIDLGYKIEE